MRIKLATKTQLTHDLGGIRFVPFGVRCLLVVLTFLTASISGWAQDESRDEFRVGELVVVGDSLSAGFQNGSLLDSQQVHGYAALVARQSHAPLALPLIAPPGIPNVLQLVSPGPPPVIAVAPGLSSGRDNPGLQAFDLAVPGANVQDALTTRPTFTFNNLTDFVLGLPGLFEGPTSKSQVEWAERLHPRTIIVWLGNNDALSSVTSADISHLTPVPQFEQAYTEVMNRLSAAGARLITANIGDATTVPFLTSAEDVARLTGLPLAVIGPVLGISAGDFVTPSAAPLIQDILTGKRPGPLPGNVVLDATKIASIRAAIASYNGIIAEQARRHGVAVVDIHLLLDRLNRDGIVVDGQKLTTKFLGGLFSLDGIHPTNTGYAIVANAFIKALNERFDADIEHVSVEDVKESDPLVPAATAREEHALEHIDQEKVQEMRRVIEHER